MVRNRNEAKRNAASPYISGAGLGFLFMLVLCFISIAVAISLDFRTYHLASTGLIARDAIPHVATDTQHVLHVVKIGVGLNSDQVNLILDTKSPDLWLIGPDSRCGENGPQCGGNGVYHAESSNLLEHTYHTFNSSSAVGFLYEGELVKDTLWLGQLAVPNCSFGLVNSTTATFGSLGLGARETLRNTSDNGFIHSMVSNGLIDQPLYLIFYDSEESNGGTIAFGQIDSSRYLGKLQNIPYFTLNDSNRPYVYADKVSLANTHGEIALNAGINRVIFDNQRTITYLTPEILRNLLRSVQGGNLTDRGLQVPCNLSSKVVLRFTFQNSTITIPVKKLLTRVGDHCYVGLATSNSNYIILGENVIRHIYSVYDLKRKQISVASVQFVNQADLTRNTLLVPTPVSSTFVYLPLTTKMADTEPEILYDTGASSQNQKVIVSAATLSAKIMSSSTIHSELQPSLTHSVGQAPGFQRSRVQSFVIALILCLL